MAVTIFVEGVADKRFLEDFIEFHFDSDKVNIASFVIVNGKDGSISTYTVKKLDTKTVIADDVFVYNKAKYPTAEVVDLRD